MSENNSLNDKYQKIEENVAEIITEKESEKEKKPKEKKAKEPMASKDKKTKKEKKEKEPKEKKIKEPKVPKEKKKKEPKEKNQKEKHGLKNKKDRDAASMPAEEKSAENEELKTEKVAIEVEPHRQKEEIIFDDIDASKYLQSETEEAEETTVNSINEFVTEEMLPVSEDETFEKEEFDSKKKKEKKSKTPKEKKEKVKKIKEKKSEKLKKEKKIKEKKPRDPLEKKDVVTIIIAVVAIILALVFGFIIFFNSRTEDQKGELVRKYVFLGKIFPDYAVEQGKPNENTDEGKLANAQITRNGILANLVQTDIPNIFYGINSDYTVQYYQYRDGEVLPVKYTNSIPLKIDMGSAILNIKMNYIKIEDYVYGISVFSSSDNADDVTYFYDLVVFKMTVMPSKYKQEGHALLLASTDKSALMSNDILWSESFDVNLETGAMTRFLSVVNRTIDERGAGVTDFCILPKSGYTSSLQSLPFISSREYPAGAGLQDIFVKNGTKETLLASDIYGKFFVTDAASVIYLRKTTTGFDVIKNTDGVEKVTGSFYGFMGTNYMISGNYILSKGDGKLYNIVSGREYTLVGYSMNADALAISNDGKYAVMMGTVKNALDYQIHVFNLETGEYVKLPDKNYAPHINLCFIDNTTVLYTAVDPNQGYEYVVFDVTKTFENE